MSWTTSDVPDQSRRRTVVTGANSGIGREAAREFARADAAVERRERSGAATGVASALPTQEPVV